RRRTRPARARCVRESPPRAARGLTKTPAPAVRRRAVHLAAVPLRARTTVRAAPAAAQDGSCSRSCSSFVQKVPGPCRLEWRTLRGPVGRDLVHGRAALDLLA